ncbi:hypothetical protein MTO96_018737 [Rhipicephalus appendiculatus]
MSLNENPFPVKERNPKLPRYDLPRYGVDAEGYAYMEPLRTEDLPTPPPSNATRTHNRLMAALVCVVALASVTTATVVIIMTQRSEIAGIDFRTAQDDATREYFLKFDTGDASNASYDVTSPLYSAEFNESFTLSQTVAEPTQSVLAD